ncbi:hypothetical protein MYP_4702 [Sporocytophaga myxococcoides]|uniref:Uncharacterized protein n=1 Tax=Sporocytophaga myxococcoides TaxID=153721 RepID=A0A098LM93_9BACT|nr:hypothetical protein [Sporocytophaga myxococcoides]GAL87472.1 hypothetical protein MYP_4702 [Sporocytophaga myxococcoides]
MKKVIFSVIFSVLVAFGTSFAAVVSDSNISVVVKDKDKDKKKKKKECATKSNCSTSKKSCCASKGAENSAAPAEQKAAE